MPCFDRISSNFPIAKGRKTRNGRGANPDQGQGQDLEAGREVGPDQDHQIDTEEGIMNCPNWKFFHHRTQGYIY